MLTIASQIVYSFLHSLVTSLVEVFLFLLHDDDLPWYNAEKQYVAEL